MTFFFTLQVAALSQALNFFDKFRKNQESKEDKTGGPDAAEIEDLACNLQEASQGASGTANKVGKVSFCNLSLRKRTGPYVRGSVRCCFSRLLRLYVCLRLICGRF